MSGVPVILHLLATDAGVTALVPSDRIVGDTLPIGTPLNAISVTSVSAVDRTPVSSLPGSPMHVRERVQATIHANSRPEAKDILKAVRRVGRLNPQPIAADVSDVRILLDGAGPDFGDEQSAIKLQTQDFRVSYNEPA